jgi:hypothetical protein
MTHGIVVRRRQLLEHGQERVFTILALLSPMAGNSPSRVARPSGRGERKAGLSEGPEKSVLCGREDLGSTDIS